MVWFRGLSMFERSVCERIRDVLLGKGIVGQCGTLLIILTCINPSYPSQMTDTTGATADLKNFSLACAKSNVKGKFVIAE